MKKDVWPHNRLIRSYRKYWRIAGLLFHLIAGYSPPNTPSSHFANTWSCVHQHSYDRHRAQHVGSSTDTNKL